MMTQADITKNTKISIGLAIAIFLMTSSLLIGSLNFASRFGALETTVNSMSKDAESSQSRLGKIEDRLARIETRVDELKKRK